MFRSLSIFICLICVLPMLSAQNEVFFNIHHKLESDDFGFEKVASNNLLTDFKITRMEYYISEISLFHDGGQELKIPDLWILNDAAYPSITSLGIHNITHLEKVVFHAGVDGAHNNGDPSVYPAGHPLALKLPSMHWGWASGYNFVAMEGVGDVNLDKVFQIHALGNENYKAVEIIVDEYASNNRMDIDIAADYSKSMYDLDAGIGIFYHGPSKQSRKLMDNFQKYVFSNASGPAHIKSTTTDLQFKLSPNLISPEGSFKVNANNAKPFSIRITSMDGVLVAQHNNINDGASIPASGLSSGNYIVSKLENGMISGSKRLVISGK